MEIKKIKSDDLERGGRLGSSGDSMRQIEHMVLAILGKNDDAFCKEGYERIRDDSYRAGGRTMMHSERGRYQFVAR